MGNKGLAAAVCVTILIPTVSAADDAPLNYLSQEVAALHVLYNLQFEKPQLENLKKIAAKTVDAPGRRQPLGSDKLRDILVKLRAVLAKADDEELIDKTYAEYDALVAKEKPSLDDIFDITDEARAQAPNVVRLMTPGQVAEYLAIFAETTPDPFDLLRQALSDVRTLKEDEWKLYRVEIADEIAWMLAGVDADKGEDLANKAVQLLIVSRGMNDDDFKRNQPMLETKIRDLVGKVGPIDVLRHLMEYHLADLLSNPRLIAAVELKLKNG